MVELIDLIDRMAAALKTALPEAEILKAYPAAPAGTALNRPLVILEQGAVTVKGRALGDYLPGGMGKRVKAAVKFTICAPLRLGGEACARLFSVLCQTLLFNSAYGITSMTAGSVRINSEKHACELTATAVLEMELRKGGNG